MKPAEDSDSATLVEAAFLLKLSEKTLRKRIQAGTIPATKEPLPDGGQAWQIPRAWLRSQGIDVERAGTVSEVESEAFRNAPELETASVEREAEPVAVSAPEESRNRVGTESEGSVPLVEYLEHIKAELLETRAQLVELNRANSELRAVVMQQARSLAALQERVLLPLEAPTAADQPPGVQVSAPAVKAAPRPPQRHRGQALKMLRQAIAILFGGSR